MNDFTMTLVKHPTRNLYKIETQPANIAHMLKSHMVLNLRTGPQLVLGGDNDYYRIQEINNLVQSLGMEKV